MADTPQGETGTPVAPSNEPGNTPAPATDNKSADVEAAKREAEQARMRANQLANEKKELEDKLAAQERQKLEENEEYKTLAEKLQSELAEIKDTQNREATRLALNSATEGILQDYPENVREVAKTTGLGLSEDSEAAKADLKAKLDTIKSKVGGANPVGANNPAPTTPEQVDRETLVKRDAPGGESPMAMAGAKGDSSVARKYISELPAIKVMRKQAGLSE